MPIAMSEDGARPGFGDLDPNSLIARILGPGPSRKPGAQVNGTGRGRGRGKRRKAPTRRSPSPKESGPTGPPPEWMLVLGLQEPEQPLQSWRSTVAISRASRPGCVLQDLDRVEWTLRGLTMHAQLQQVMWNSVVVPPGRFLTTPCLHIAGCEAFLRFWPNGYFSSCTRKERAAGEKAGTQDLGGIDPDSWCAIGLWMPAGSRLRLRFFVGDQTSEIKLCHFEGTRFGREQVWTPKQQDPVSMENLVVGLQVVEDLRIHMPRLQKLGILRPGTARERRSPSPLVPRPPQVQRTRAPLSARLPGAADLRRRLPQAV